VADSISDPSSNPGESGDGAHPLGERAIVQVDWRTAVWIVGALLLGFGIFALARNTEAMLTRIVIGVILALALDGVVNLMCRRLGLRRSVAVGIVGIGLLGLAALILLVLGPPAVSQAKQFSREIPATVKQFYDLPIVGHPLEKADAAGKVQKWINELPANVSDQAIAKTAERLVGGVFSMVVVLFTTFALLLDGERLVNRGRRLLPVRLRDDADRIARVLQRTIGRYFGGSLTVAALMGLYVLTIGLVFNVPLAPLAAIWAMFTDLIPQVGGFLGGAFLFILAVSNSVPTAIIVVILFVVYMNLENHLINPAIVGQAVNLTPPSTMLAAFIGGAVAGVPGALIATPLVGAGKQLYLEFRYGGVPAKKHRRPGAALMTRLRNLVGRGRDTPPVSE
jgi:predicted PurR-regulated permease PerM